MIKFIFQHRLSSLLIILGGLSIFSVIAYYLIPRKSKMDRGAHKSLVDRIEDIGRMGDENKAEEKLVLLDESEEDDESESDDGETALRTEEESNKAKFTESFENALRLGSKYFSGQSYEKALMHFTEAIKIAPLINCPNAKIASLYNNRRYTINKSS